MRCQLTNTGNHILMFKGDHETFHQKKFSTLEDEVAFINRTLKPCVLLNEKMEYVTSSRVYRPYFEVLNKNQLPLYYRFNIDHWRSSINATPLFDSFSFTFYLRRDGVELSWQQYEVEDEMNESLPQMVIHTRMFNEANKLDLLLKQTTQNVKRKELALENLKRDWDTQLVNESVLNGDMLEIKSGYRIRLGTTTKAKGLRYFLMLKQFKLKDMLTVTASNVQMIGKDDEHLEDEVKTQLEVFKKECRLIERLS